MKVVLARQGAVGRATRELMQSAEKREAVQFEPPPVAFWASSRKAAPRQRCACSPCGCAAEVGHALPSRCSRRRGTASCRCGSARGATAAATPPGVLGFHHVGERAAMPSRLRVVEMRHQATALRRRFQLRT